MFAMVMSMNLKSPITISVIISYFQECSFYFFVFITTDSFPLILCNYFNFRSLICIHQDQYLKGCLVFLVCYIQIFSLIQIKITFLFEMHFIWWVHPWTFRKIPIILYHITKFLWHFLACCFMISIFLSFYPLLSFVVIFLLFSFIFITSSMKVCIAYLSF